MGKKPFVIIAAIIICVVLIVTWFFNDRGGTSFSSSNTGERGASLLFDTLRHMNYPARASYRPLTRQTNTSVVYIIIQPQSPEITNEIANEFLDWVERGGRLILLANGNQRFAPEAAAQARAQEQNAGEFSLYRIGNGELVIGTSSLISNRSLMHNHTHGEIVQSTISRWHSEREVENIFFAEYYHGFHAPENMVGRLPLVIRLILAQAVILAVIFIWYAGKRFGNPVPYYEEVEREENEYVRALARLYMATRKNRRR
jgi:hypothetical protein